MKQIYLQGGPKDGRWVFHDRKDPYYVFHETINPAEASFEVDPPAIDLKKRFRTGLYRRGLNAWKTTLDHYVPIYEWKGWT